jgi:hypothetical protein
MSDPFLTSAMFMEGACAFGFLIATLFFLRFWRRTHDRLFLYFAIAFLIMAANHAVVSLWQIPGQRAYFYLPRLVAFLLIICGIVDKNLPRDGKGPHS